MGAPLAHTTKVAVERSWKLFHEIPALKRPEVKILNGKARSVDFENKMLTFTSNPALENEQGNEVKVHYDYLVAATGLRRQWPIAPQAKDKDSYMKDAIRQIEKLERVEGNIVVVGGGAVGIEVAGEIKHSYPTKNVILVHSREDLLSSEPLPSQFKQVTKDILHQTGVTVVTGSRIIKEEIDGAQTKLFTSAGDVLIAEVTIFCTAKSKPRSEYLSRMALDEDGYVKVAPSLNFAADIPHPCCHFAVGDIVAWPGIRRVGRALLMGQCAAVNIIKTMVAKEGSDSSKIQPLNLVEFPKFAPRMALAIGDESVAMSPHGEIKWGKEVRKRVFGDDLGLTRCWNDLTISKL
ncbi:MAG: hypothetical protein M1834_003713 [Cirrosporium novae-zelandiae]|nr:MAG: hypothetical protein M1834_003713 [Cirrosporium novae-zelandiae]